MIIHRPIEKVVIKLIDATNWRWPGPWSLVKVEIEDSNVIKATYIRDPRIEEDYYMIRWSVSRTDQNGSQVVTFTDVDLNPPQIEITYTLTPTNNGASTDVERDPPDDMLLLCLAAASGDAEAHRSVEVREHDPGIVPHHGPP